MGSCSPPEQGAVSHLPLAEEEKCKPLTHSSAPGQGRQGFVICWMAVKCLGMSLSGSVSLLHSSWFASLPHRRTTRSCLVVLLTSPPSSSGWALGRAGPRPGLSAPEPRPAPPEALRMRSGASLRRRRQLCSVVSSAQSALLPSSNGQPPPPGQQHLLQEGPWDVPCGTLHSPSGIPNPIVACCDLRQITESSKLHFTNLQNRARAFFCCFFKCSLFIFIDLIGVYIDVRCAAL